jgi:competence protein CoiA
MQLYALDCDQFTFISEANKEKTYRCPECLNPLRLRGGPHRQLHFYHLKNHPTCRQHQKSLTHLQVQWRVQAQFPANDALLEVPFPQIGRIADVACEKNKTIFEIQCSPISLEEAENRCRDYERLGFRVIWILHDQRFNRKRMSAAEIFLRQRMTFFTNIDDKGKGLIYDQQESCLGALRLFRGPRFPVDLTDPQRIPPLPAPHVQKAKFSFSRLYRFLLNMALENI